MTETILHGFADHGVERPYNGNHLVNTPQYCGVLEP